MANHWGTSWGATWANSWTGNVVTPPPVQDTSIGAGATVLSNHGPATGRYFSKKEWYALLEEIRLEREAVTPSKAKSAVAAVAKASKAALEAVEAERVDAAQAEQLARKIEAARSAAKAADAIKRADEALAMAKALQSTMDEEDEDDIMLMIWAIH